MKLIVEIETNDNNLQFDLFENKELKKGKTAITIEKGVSMRKSNNLNKFSAFLFWEFLDFRVL